jgi:Lrp/AsnC family transcriptional regulator, leucine-responsive regulatory protein
MDAIDLQIIKLLQTNARLSQEALAREVNLSRPAVHERLRRLEAEHIITGYQAQVNWDALGYLITAFIWVRTTGVHCQDSARTLMGLSHDPALIEECHRVAGEWCVLLKVRTRTPRDLERLIDNIRDCPGVVATMTTLAFSDLSECMIDDT